MTFQTLLLEHKRLPEEKLRYLHDFQIDLNNRQDAINRINCEVRILESID